MSPTNPKEGSKCNLVCHPIQKWICSQDSYPYCNVQWVMKCKAPISIVSTKQSQ